MARRVGRRPGKPRVSKGDAGRIREALRKLRGGEPDALFPPPLDRIREITSLEFQPGAADTYAALLESICGVADDSQPVEQYDGTLGVTVAFVNAHQAPVGQLQWNANLGAIYTNPGDVSGVRWCSGTLISNDLFLAAGHCFDQTGGGWTRPRDNTTGATISPAEIATNMHVNFNYQVDPTGALRTEQSFAVQALVEYRLGGLDFAIVRLGGNPGTTYGITQVATTDPAVGDMLCIIGHPAGMPKRIEAGPTTTVSGTTITYNDIDTLGGNSGSGLLRASDGRLVGVHTNGGCNAAGTGANSGVRMTSIIAQSPVLQALTIPTFKFRDDIIPKLKFRDDIIPKLKFRDDGVATLKAIDDVKLPGLDKQFDDRKLVGREAAVDPSWYGMQPLPGGGARPFILSTPHHSMAWARSAAAAAGGRVTREELGQYEQALTQLASVIQRGWTEVSELDAAYSQLLAEYEALVSPRT